jgi:Putative adhesin
VFAGSAIVCGMKKPHRPAQEATMQKFDTPGPISVILDIPAGRVEFAAADRAFTTVEVRPADASKARDVKLAEQTTVEYRDGVLRIKASASVKNQVLGPSGAVELKVELPAGSRIETTAASAEFRGAGRFGEVVLETQHGGVRIDEASSVRLITAAGDVSVGCLTGPAQISTRKGDIRIGEAMRGTLTLRTEYGEISVGAAHAVSARMDAGTSYGRIDNALNNCDGAAAGLNIHATTSYGNITARSL